VKKKNERKNHRPFLLPQKQEVEGVTTLLCQGNGLTFPPYFSDDLSKKTEIINQMKY